LYIFTGEKGTSVLQKRAAHQPIRVNMLRTGKKGEREGKQDEEDKIQKPDLPGNPLPSTLPHDVGAKDA